MLSGTLEKKEDWDVGKHRLFVKLIQGIFHSSPPKPKYTGFEAQIQFWIISSR
jgi:hypothetical protein